MLLRRSSFLAALISACAGTAPQGGSAERYDLLISGGTLADGSGDPMVPADVALRGDRIVRVSRIPLPQGSASRVIDATDKVVAPGFIDLHVHIERLLSLPAAEHFVRQGVTTLVGNPDGGWLPHRQVP